ncbi:MAG: UDP-glucose/GDP-mannose dehydrogenase family protein [Candidatus Micrarchaeia archaeon]
MKICVIGTGYVGLITGCGFAKLGHDVACIDIDKSKVDMINKGIPPIYEAGLAALLSKVAGKNLNAATDLQSAVRNSEFVFITVGTPSGKDGSIDLSYVKAAFAEALNAIGSGNDGRQSKIFVVKSTVVPGTTDSLAKFGEEKTGKRAGVDYGLCMNPEFLREGKALDDFFEPDRVVIGTEENSTMERMLQLYSGFKCPIIKTNRKTAEMIKYASNSFLAVKVSFMNEVGNICKKSGMDIYTVLEGMKHDSRIGGIFMNAGAGFGGSCFPKDVSALANYAKSSGYEPMMLNAALETNKKQPLKMVEIAKKKYGSLSGKKAAVLGIAFKPDTDDIREAPALAVINALIEEGAKITVYDPKAMENAKKIFGESVSYADSAENALSGSEICFILTDWKEFKDPSLYGKVFVIDGRNVIRRKENYEGICW